MPSPSYAIEQPVIHLDQFDSTASMPEQAPVIPEADVVQEGGHLARLRACGATIVEFAKENSRKVALVGSLGAVAAMGVGLVNPERAEAKGKNPAYFMKSTKRIYEKEYNGGDRESHINVKKTVLGSHTLILKGKCDKNDPYRYSVGFIENLPSVQKIGFCFMSRVTKNKTGQGYWKADFGSRMNRLGDKAAASAGIGEDEYGDTTKIVATKSKARISFAPVATVSENAPRKQLQAITIRKGKKKPVSEWYSASELAKATQEAPQLAE